MTYFEKNLCSNRRRQVLAFGSLFVATAAMTFTMTLPAALFVLAAVTFVAANAAITNKSAQTARKILR